MPRSVRAGGMFIALGLLGLVLGAGGGAHIGSGGGDGLVQGESLDANLTLADLTAPERVAGAAEDARPRIPDATVATDPDPARPDMALMRRSLDLLESHYLLPQKLSPEDLFRGAVQRLAATTDDGLFLEGQDGGLDTLMIGHRAVLLDGASLKSTDDLVDALGSVASFYRQASVFSELETNEDLEQALIAGMMSTLDSPTRLLIKRGLENFQVRSRGSLIGVGLVLRVLDGHPQVIEVVESGPSRRAGVSRGDRILRIDGESTLDMPIREVVSRLRGEQGSSVSFAAKRRGHADLVSFEIIREKVKVANVRAARLSGDIGYLEITNFSDLTLSNFRIKMAELNQGSPLKGFILDLRANRGGSLRQSAFMADQFLTEGLLVRTVGRDDQRVRGLVERIDATSDVSINPQVPVVVLVGPRTASGAEILAGSLKYHDRAVIVGRGTFGKGTVQKVYKVAPKASLKATVARYLLEGDHWIHKVGIEPDIELNSIVLDDDKVRYNDTGDLAAQLAPDTDEEDPFSGVAEPKALLRLAYVQDRTVAAGDEVGADSADAEAPEPTPVPTREERLAEDFEVKFAAQLLSSVGDPSRAEMLSSAPAVVEKVEAEQAATLATSLRGRGVDWSPANDVSAQYGVPQFDTLSVRLEGSEPASAKIVPSSEDVSLTLVAEIGGAAPLHRVRAVTMSADRALSGHDFMIGRLRPGEPVRVSLPIRLPPSVQPGLREVKVMVIADELDMPIELTQLVDVQDVQRPVVEAHVRYLDNGESGSRGDGDFVPEPGERITLEIGVANSGAVSTGEVTVSVRNPLRKDVEVVESRVRLDPIEPGAKETANLTIDILAVPDVTMLPPVEVKIVVADRTFDFRLSEPLVLAAEEETSPVYSAPSWAATGQLFKAPTIVLRSVSPSGPVDGGVVELSVAASDADGLRVLSLYNDNVKVGRLIGGVGAQALDLQQSIPLEAGTHLIEVRAEDETGLTTRARRWVTAAAPSGQVEAEAQ